MVVGTEPAGIFRSFSWMAAGYLCAAWFFFLLFTQFVPIPDFAMDLHGVGRKRQWIILFSPYAIFLSLGVFGEIVGCAGGGVLAVTTRLLRIAEARRLMLFAGLLLFVAVRVMSL